MPPDQGYGILLKAALSILGPVYVILAVGGAAALILRAAARRRQARRGPIKVEKQDVRYKIS